MCMGPGSDLILGAMTQRSERTWQRSRGKEGKEEKKKKTEDRKGKEPKKDEE